MIRRREFIAGLGAAACPLSARAQQVERLQRVGCLYAYAGNDPIVQARVAVFREGLAQLGWTERNLQIEERFAQDDSNQLQAYAAELVGSAPDVVVANSTPVLAALKQATHTIPIVFSIVSDPAGQSFVDTPWAQRASRGEGTLRRQGISLPPDQAAGRTEPIQSAVINQRPDLKATPLGGSCYSSCASSSTSPRRDSRPNWPP
jgi:hypothetical protein